MNRSNSTVINFHLMLKRFAERFKQSWSKKNCLANYYFKSNGLHQLAGARRLEPIGIDLIQLVYQRVEQLWENTKRRIQLVELRCCRFSRLPRPKAKIYCIVFFSFLLRSTFDWLMIFFRDRKMICTVSIRTDWSFCPTVATKRLRICSKRCC